MSSFRDDPIKDLGFVVFPASAGLDQRDCRFHAFPLYLWKFTKPNSFILTGFETIPAVRRLHMLVGR